MSKQDLLSYIELRQSQIDDLIRRWGDGVRPASVGEEIMILNLHLEVAQQQLAAMEASNETR
jgi:hypothetical protein